MIRSLQPKSVRVRLTLWYVGTLAFVLVLYSVGLYYFLSQNLFEEIDRKLHADLELANDAITGDGLTSTLDSLKANGLQERWLVEVFDIEGKLLGSVPQENQPLLGPIGERCREHLGFTGSVHTLDGLNLRMRCGIVKARGRDLVVRVARPTERIQGELERFRFIILLGLPLAIVLTSIGGYLLSRKLLRPISEMTEAAGRISGENLSERLKVDNPDDELGKLAIAFNATFSSLDRTFGEMKRFTADASHELRTPLTVIRTVGEVALRDQHSPSGYRDIIANMLEESDRLRQLVESLLTLSRADAGQFSLELGNHDVAALTLDVIGHLSVLAEEKKQQMRLVAPGPTYAKVDPKILRQALINIVHNAIKYAGESARIEIRISAKLDSRIIQVEDSGPGIGIEHHAKLFDRFYRVDSGRSRVEGGSGLGLAIARWAVEANGGIIELESAPGKGSVFRIILKGTET